ncbi:MAG: glycosyltransferase, partial [Phycisphaerae bacterium]
SHFNPLSRCTALDKIVVVGDEPLEPLPKFVYNCPPKWLQRLISRPFARLVWTWRVTGKHDAGLLMGYHIMPNSLICLFVAALRNRKAIYQMTGGPTQIIGGGYNGENSILRRLGRPSARRQRWMIRTAKAFDAIIVRGNRALDYVNEHELSEFCRIIPGGADVQAFSDIPPPEEREFDLIVVGRLVPVKRVDRAIRIFAALAKPNTHFKMLIVGDGPLRTELEALAESHGVRARISFVGQRHDVESQLIRARLFLLTSEIEGLSIAMIEAMAAGLPPMVPKIGDLAYLLIDEQTGVFINPDDPEDAARRIASILTDPARLAMLGNAARQIAFQRCDYGSIANDWDKIFTALQAVRAPHPPKKVRAALSRKNMWERAPEWVRKCAGIVLTRIPTDQLLGRRFQKELALARSAEQWTCQQVREHQTRALQSICSLAAEKSAFYRELFAQFAFDPAQLKRPEDIQKLPIIDKETLRENLNDMTTKSPVNPGVDKISTGGSSGEPLSFYIGSNRSAIEFACLVRLWERAGFRLGMPTAVFRGEVVVKNPEGMYARYDPVLHRHYFSNFHMTDDDMHRYLSAVVRLKHCGLLVYPSSAYALARFIERGGHKRLTNVAFVLAGSEMTYPGQRQMIESAFNARYFSWYGHSEKLVLAGECEHTTDYHVLPTYGYCELIDDEGNPVTEPGQQGEIVGTGFINRVVPFLRYRTGDWATYVGNECEKCGRKSLIFRDVVGHRVQEQLVLSDGSAVPWVALNMHDDTFDNVRQFQFYQDTPGRCVLKIVTEASFREENAARILRNLDRKLDGRMEVTINRVEEIPLTRNGKTIYVDQKIKASNPEPREGVLS